MQSTDRVKELIYNLTPANKEQLNDENLSDVLNLLNANEQVVTIDSLTTTQLTADIREERRIHHLNIILAVIHNSTSDQMILLPLFFNNHWSLLALFRVTNTTLPYRFIHLDSYAPSHTNYCMSVINLIGRQLVNPQPYRLPRVVPKQNDDWQCGHFVLMNARMLIQFQESCQLSNPNSYEARLRRHLLAELLSSSYRNIKSFADSIIDLLSV